MGEFPLPFSGGIVLGELIRNMVAAKKSAPMMRDVRLWWRNLGVGWSSPQPHLIIVILCAQKEMT